MFPRRGTSCSQMSDVCLVVAAHGKRVDQLCFIRIATTRSFCFHPLTAMATHDESQTLRPPNHLKHA